MSEETSWVAKSMEKAHMDVIVLLVSDSPNVFSIVNKKFAVCGRLYWHYIRRYIYCGYVRVGICVCKCYRLSSSAGSDVKHVKQPLKRRFVQAIAVEQEVVLRIQSLLFPFIVRKQIFAINPVSMIEPTIFLDVIFGFRSHGGVVAFRSRINVADTTVSVLVTPLNMDYWRCLLCYDCVSQ
ncbi:hypothetical protein GQ44DRAFT_733997 [Phaeosphaeriaceae sp. PMI808]|nr:hypothetical protein GQ44DRAFT_733997 [Phaeosphaeriaceae sp. PMI808]